MTHSDWNTIVLLLVAALNAYTAYMARKTEKNTNSMKDALVESTAKASLGEGTAAGMAAGRAAGLAEGRSEMRDPDTPVKVEITKYPPVAKP